VKEKFYIVFAGINGAGKSTFFRSGLWHREVFPESMNRINSDEILRESGGDWSSQTDQFRAMKEATRRIEENFALGKSFNQETTLTGKKCIRDIIRAHDLGYKVIMFYVGVNHPDIANNRIAHRVSMGGHSIEPEDVRRRFEASMLNLSMAINMCEETFLFDNTYAFTLLRVYRQGSLEYDRVVPHVTWIQNLT